MPNAHVAMLAFVQYNNSFKAFKEPIAANLAAIQSLLLKVPVRTRLKLNFVEVILSTCLGIYYCV